MPRGLARVKTFSEAAPSPLLAPVPLLEPAGDRAMFHAMVATNCEGSRLNDCSIDPCLEKRRGFVRKLNAR